VEGRAVGAEQGRERGVEVCAGGVARRGHALPLGPPEEQQVRPRVDDRPSALLGVVERADHLDHAVRERPLDERRRRA
jgi:hypothetical protein